MWGRPCVDLWVEERCHAVSVACVPASYLQPDSVGMRSRKPQHARTRGKLQHKAGRNRHGQRKDVAARTCRVGLGAASSGGGARAEAVFLSLVKRRYCERSCHFHCDVHGRVGAVWCTGMSVCAPMHIASPPPSLWLFPALPLSLSPLPLPDTPTDTPSQHSHSPPSQ